jgi:VanZ family protein
MRIALPPAQGLRIVCFATFLVVLIQLFFLAEPPLLRELKNFFWDKSLHAMAFGSFAALLWFAFGYRHPIGNCVLIAAIGAVDEFHQIFIPTRTADIFDVAADIIGAAIATFILHRLSRPAPAQAVSADIVVQPGD